MPAINQNKVKSTDDTRNDAGMLVVVDDSDDESNARVMPQSFTKSAKCSSLGSQN
jgi:hypothetical protein